MYAHWFCPKFPRYPLTTAIDCNPLFSYSKNMEIAIASLPLAVRAPGLQPKVSPASLQPAQKTGTALTVVRSEPSLSVLTGGASISATSPPNMSVAVLKRQLFEFSLETLTGAFSRLVASVFGFRPAVAPSLTAKPAPDIHPEFVSSTAESQPVLQAQEYQRAAEPVSTDSVLPASVQQASHQQPIMPEFIESSSGVHAAFAPATVIPPLTQLATSPVSPVPAAVVAVTEVFRSTPPEQHKERRLDIFDVAFAARNHAIHPQTLSGNHLDRFA